LPISLRSSTSRSPRASAFTSSSRHGDGPLGLSRVLPARLVNLVWLMTTLRRRLETPGLRARAQIERFELHILLRYVIRTYANSAAALP